MRTLCTATLLSEFLVIALAALAVVRLSKESPGTVWAVSGAAMALCLLLCALLERPGAVPLGWALQVGLVASGLVLPVMFLLGAIFAVVWGISVHFGRKVDAIKAARA